MKCLLSILVLVSVSFLGVNHKAEAKTVKAECGFFDWDCISIFKAVRKGDFESVKQYVAQGGDVNAQNDAYFAPLHYAAEKGDMQIVQFLVYKEADLNIKAENYNDKTPLHIAIEGNHTDIAKFLILQEADVNAKTYHGYTPLHYAARRDQIEVVKLLVAAGAEVNIRNRKGRTPLSYVYDNSKTRDFLISKKATY